MAPPVFGDLGKSVKDLLSQGFSYTNKVDVSTDVAGMKTKVTASAPNLNNVSGDVQLTYNENNVEVKATASHDLKVKADVAVKEVAPGLKLTGSVDTNLSGSAGFVYNGHHHATVNGKVTFGGALNANAGVVLGFGDLQMGAAVDYDGRSESLSDVHLATTYAYGDLNMLFSTSNFNAYTLGAAKPVNDDVKVGLLFEQNLLDGKQVFTAGAAYRVDSNVTAKVKANSAGILSASVSGKITDQASVTAAAEINGQTFDIGTARFGVGVSVSL